MNTKTTVVLLVVVVAVAAWIKFYEKDLPNTEEAKRRAGTVLNFERENVEGILIHNGDDRIELRRSGDNWRLEAPIKDQADRTLIDGLLANLETWPKESTITEKELQQQNLSLEEYDLQKPKLRVKLLGKEMPPEILFGKDAAFENRMYVRFENSKEAYVAAQTVRADVAKKAEEFRDRKLTDISSAQVTRVVLKTAAGEMELQKQGEQWEIVKPLRARAETQKVADLISQVTAARIEQFVADDRGDLQPYGLAEPRGAITLFTDEDQQGQMLQIGSTPGKEQEQVYVRFSARQFVYTLPKKIDAILNATPAELRDRHLVRFDTNQLDRISIDAPGAGKTVLARKDQGWVIGNRNDQPANSTEVTRLIDTLQNQQVTRFVEDVASDLAKYGLDQPQLQLTLSSFASENTAESAAGEQPLATVAFGRVEGEEVFARVGEEPFIVAVSRDFLGKIFTDPAQWQELAIFKFQPEQVHRLTVRTDREITLTRGPNNDWSPAEGSGPIDQVSVQSLVNTLAKLRAVRWTGGGTPPQAFDQPQIAITFTTAPDDKTEHTLIVGGPAGNGMWYARVEGRDGIFIMSNPDFNALRLPLRPETAAPPTSTESPAAGEPPPTEPAGEPEPVPTP